ncbi:hypothetical protein BCR41DRAFT_109431 [Lobosporangium transversale]|uniref:Transmembrane protein n=1 Tax=Lobosporangium transversale TaxID=64571 RepID=A0A1Y2GJZ9_9FUNG|nr:hypothetical protein BCR41DRAFT_113863 [Lobosporangium transversale]XP_021879862.1 hypothetical protein BCR41DRAFT_109431 [Lobosporangium transversale]ORZ10929.1 hypothetical protein BCR41DRAFT_113863 [Lobosporangium transversale]ORZ11765.1 hypothetical protein BCR41DRAFT_109431 [Lobosporangium transversale]|eukprot:XP_021879446.1 hypothetical protein BCR41DRAFT_113863 [Lobosporangium transversale]
MTLVYPRGVKSKKGVERKKGKVIQWAMKRCFGGIVLSVSFIRASGSLFLHDVPSFFLVIPSLIVIQLVVLKLIL